MNFTISGEDFTFELETDVNGVLTSFTATEDSTIFDCLILMKSQSLVPMQLFCCTPSGCTSGPCLDL